mgnify:CR=1 FL=1
MTQVIKEFELYIFDLDGTILDTFADIATATNQTLRSFGVEPLPVDQVRSYVGQGAKWMLSQSLQAAGLTGKEEMEKALEMFPTLYLKHIADETRPYPGALETLKGLKAKGKTIALCTNKPYDWTIKLLGLLGITEHFEHILGGDSLDKKKPDPAPIYHMLDHFKASPKQTVMVGDSIYDIHAGNRADTFTCGIDYGVHSLQQLKEASADYLIKNLQELL